MLKLLPESKPRKPWAWTANNEARANDLLAVFEELRRWWPLTARQAYYRLISSNRVKAPHWHKHGNVEKGRVDVYASILRVLKHMRLAEKLPWDAITDEHRTVSPKVGFADTREFLISELDNFCSGYRRCLAQKQGKYIEVWIEKAALFHIVEPIVTQYCRRTVVCRGYNSVTFLADFYQRATQALMQGQEPVVLYYGDFDPSGVDMFRASIKTLTGEMGLCSTTFYRGGINPDQFHLLESDPVPIKPTDSRAKAFVEEHGTVAYELDAFHPSQLERLVFDDLYSLTDMEAVREDLEQEERDKARLQYIKGAVVDYLVEAIVE